MLLNPEDSLTEIRAFLSTVAGRKILHISDTPTKLYPSLERMVREIRPDVIFHTGDCADEYKVGRRKADIPAYKEAVPALFKSLTAYSGKAYVIPGNNDLPEVLNNLPGVEVLPEWTRMEIDKVRLELSHFPNPAAFDRDFALYGHSASPDLRYGLSEETPGPVYINGNFEYALIDSETKNFIRIPYKAKSGCMRIFIARHGQPESSDGNENPNFPVGDPPLTGDGIRQAKYLALELKKRQFTGKIYSSPFLRALETARETAHMTGGEIFVEPDIREIAKKTTISTDFRGETLEERMKRIPEISMESEARYPWWDTTPETGDDVYRRVAPVLVRILKQGEDAVLFAHGAVVNACIRYLTERAKGALRAFRYYDDHLAYIENGCGGNLRMCGELRRVHVPLELSQPPQNEHGRNFKTHQL